MHDLTWNQPALSVEVNPINMRLYTLVELMGTNSWPISRIASHYFFRGHPRALKHAITKLVYQAEEERLVFKILRLLLATPNETAVEKI